MKIKNVTFETWKNNHDDCHKDKWYRELYPFNVIQEIDFSEENINKEQIVDFSRIKYFITIKTIELQDNGRYKTTFEVSTQAQSKSQEWKNRKWDNIFQIIYTQNYDFITLFTKKEDPSKNIVEQFMRGNFDKISEYRSIPISEILIRTLILHIAEDTFEGGKHREVFKLSKEGVREINFHPDFRLRNFHSSFSPIFSIERNLWICYSFNEEKAHRIGFYFSNQCENLYVIYCNPTYTKHQRCNIQNTHIISFYDFSNLNPTSTSKKYEKQIRYIQNHLNKPEQLDTDKLIGEIFNPKKEKYEIKKSELMEAYAFLKIKPKDNEDFFHSLCCFNLINALLSEKLDNNNKRKQKQKFKDMYFFKTYLADILTERIENKDHSISMYFTKDLIIIEIKDFQFSFNSVPMNSTLKQYQKSEYNKTIEWCGKKLQPIAPLLLNYSRALRQKKAEPITHSHFIKFTSPAGADF